ncbi:kinase-like domain-containing protein [Mycena polygramma]|nr:kinase-like domain-containing protein [Mycena polygramma]
MLSSMSPSRNPTHRPGTGDVAISLGNNVAQIAAQFAPVPWLSPVVGLICGIIQACQNVSQNRHAAFQLGDRCHRLGLALRDKAITDENIASAIDSVTRCLNEIYATMNTWATKTNKLQSFVKQTEIASDIERCHYMLADCLAIFQFDSHTEIHEWQAQLKLDTERDHNELLEYLTNIQNSQDILIDAVQSQADTIQQMMSMMQQLGNSITAGSRNHAGLSSNLYDLQCQSRLLLPDLHLKHGEVVRIGQFPLRGTPTMDLYEGIYLGHEKVAIKIVRVVDAANKNSLRCFQREAEIWQGLWKVDQGKHVLPFYGFCLEDGFPFPSMVSPWQKNGTALDYVQIADDRIDYFRLIKGVALGVQVLHSMNVVHGDLKATNIVIDDSGNPLIADFGLSRIVEDITGIPFSQSRGVSECYRWFAPEVCVGEGVLSLRSDVYAYGMTVLELFTHRVPYDYIKHTSEVVIRSVQGEHPQRPTDPVVVNRGLNDDIWMLMNRCWASKPSERPTIQMVLDMFPQ